LTPLENAAQPAMVPKLLIATATLGFASAVSFEIEPDADHALAIIDPEPGSKSAPTIVPSEFTAAAYPLLPPG
jgi:hypothetical protein